jgi:hypothetical protein
MRDNPPKRSERREPFGPPVLPRGALDSAGCPHDESRERKPGTHEMRVHASRLGGRRRLDASRVFYTGRSQGLVVQEGASQEEATKLQGMTWSGGGQKANRCADSRLLLGPRGFGLRVSACRLSIRRKALSDYGPSGFHRQGGLGSSGTQVKLRNDHVGNCEIDMGSASGG